MKSVTDPSKGPGPVHLTPANCPNCGTQLSADAVFCHRCGRNFTVEMSAKTPSGAATSDAASTDTLVRLRAALADRYAVERELGKGGMATVYLAKDLKHGREVAIKVLHPDLAASLGADRFEREIRLAANLQHPHILGLFDSGAADGLLYYVMPFVKGESLRDRLNREGQLPVEDAIGITLEVADALGCAHAQGVVHRDIKPENILLSGGHCLIADFGIARAMSEGGANKLTQTGMSMGTPFYMAPEQASGETVGPTADLYSLGCMLYEMLAGDPPFIGKNAMAIMAKHAMEQVPSIRIVRSSVPEEIENAIFHAMGKVAADRPQTAAQFAELLGVQMGSTSSMRVLRLTPTAQRRVPSGAQTMLAFPAPVAWWRKPQAIAVAALLAVGAAAGVWRMTAGRSRASANAGPDAHRLAVLYFKDLSKNQSLGPLADGLTEGLIRSLSGGSSLTVISQGGVEKFRGSSIAPDSIAKALRAGYLVRGEVEPDGANVTVSVRLDDASGVSLKRATFVRPAGNLLAMRDTLSVVASDLIKQQLGEEIHVRETASASNPDAWLMVQRGRQARKNFDAAVAKGDSAGIEHELRAADSLFAGAEKSDGKWAEPVTSRASLAYRRSRTIGRDPALIRKWVEVGLGHANRALALDPKNADALEVRGTLHYFSWLSNLEEDAARKAALIASAKEDLEKATTINPNQAGAWSTLSHLYNNFPTSTPTDVLLAAQRAYETDEFLSDAELVLSRLFLATYDLGQFDKAAQWCAEAGRRFPAGMRSARCQLFLLTTKSRTPDVPAAWRLADSVVALAPPAQKAFYRLNSNMLAASVIARASKTAPALADSARHVAKNSEGDATVDPGREYGLYGAIAYAILGDRAEAVRVLKLYLAVNPQRIAGFRDDPGWQFRDLQSDPGFRQLVGAGR